MPGLDIMVVQRADQLQPGEHAQDPVEATALDLGVEMAADQDRLRIRVRARPLGHHVADRVHLHDAACGFAPIPEQGPHLAILG